MPAKGDTRGRKDSSPHGTSGRSHSRKAFPRFRKAPKTRPELGLVCRLIQAWVQTFRFRQDKICIGYSHYEGFCMASSTNIDSILHEDRKFECPKEFSENAHIKSLQEYERIYRESIEDPEKFWGNIAAELHWFKRWDKVLEWNPPWAKWFVGGQLNLSYNCLDRHVQTARKNKAAIIWESEPGRSSHAHLSATASRSAEVRQRAEGAWSKERRPRRHLHGHDAGTARRHAGLRENRRAAHGSLRRILLQCVGRSHSRFASRGRDHAGWVVSPRR